MASIASIRALLDQVPYPPGEDIPEGVSLMDCIEFESRTGLSLPTEVRDWLMLSNGPCAGPGGFYGIRPARQLLDLETVLAQHPSWMAKGWIPIAGDGCGNTYVIATKNEFGDGHPVLFIDSQDSDDVPAYIVASGLQHFLTFILEKELGKRGWPFDRAFVISADDRIESFHSVRLPWNAE